MKMDHPTIALGVRKDKATELPTRSKSVCLHCSKKEYFI